MFNASFLLTCLLSLCVYAIASHDKARDVGHGARQPADHQKREADHTSRQEYRRQSSSLDIRRNISTLNESEQLNYRQSIQRMQRDGSYENIATIHGFPGRCTVNGARRACCAHGTSFFASWHRPYMQWWHNLQKLHGSKIFCPYWDWVTPFSALPNLFNARTFYNPVTNRTEPNPLYSGKVAGINANTSRDPQSSLFNTNYFWDRILIALEQKNICQFITQLEVLHNSIHAWLGGNVRYGMNTVDYAAYDPIFYAHHCNVDRLIAVYQALQEYRGFSPNDISCFPAGSTTRPQIPFNTSINTDEQTRTINSPQEVMDYRATYGYEYESLTVYGRTIPELAELTRDRSSTRAIAAVPVQSAARSTNVDVMACDPKASPGEICDKKVDQFHTFGGKTAMPVTYDRPYLCDITEGVKTFDVGLTDIPNIQIDLISKTLDGVLVEVERVLSSLTVELSTGLEKAIDGLLSGLNLFSDSDPFSAYWT